MNKVETTSQLIEGSRKTEIGYFDYDPLMQRGDKVSISTMNANKDCWANEVLERSGEYEITAKRIQFRYSGKNIYKLVFYDLKLVESWN